MSPALGPLDLLQTTTWHLMEIRDSLFKDARSEGWSLGVLGKIPFSCHALAFLFCNILLGTHLLRAEDGAGFLGDTWPPYFPPFPQVTKLVIEKFGSHPWLLSPVMFPVLSKGLTIPLVRASSEVPSLPSEPLQLVTHLLLLSLPHVYF